MAGGDPAGAAAARHKRRSAVRQERLNEFRADFPIASPNDLVSAFRHDIVANEQNKLVRNVEAADVESYALIRHIEDEAIAKRRVGCGPDFC